MKMKRVINCPKYGQVQVELSKSYNEEYVLRADNLFDQIGKSYLPTANFVRIYKTKALALKKYTTITCDDLKEVK
jgi:hypothetical protein